MAAGNYERLSAQDSSFILFEGPGTHMHVSAVAVFETGPLTSRSGSLDIARLRRSVASRLHLIPRYRQRLDYTPLGHPIWVDDERFNLEYHVRHTALPAPGSDDQLKALAGRIMSQQLDRAKPLWELWFVDGLSGGRFAMLGKVHHCMVDGMSGVGVMTALLSSSPETGEEPAPHWQPRMPPGRLALLGDEVWRRARTPLSLASAARRALRRPEQASSELARNAEAVWQALNTGFRLPSDTPLNLPIGTHRRIDWHSLALGDVKEVKKRLDGTVNDVVLTVVTGALRRFLDERAVALEKLRFTVAVPVNVRRPEDGEAANRVSAWLLSLPISEDEPLRRFEQIKDETRRLRESRAALGIDLLVRFADWSGSDWMTFWGTRLVSTLRPHNMIVTNVPGPRFPLYLLGARLEAMYPQLPLFERQGLGIAVMSYLDRICFGLIGDWDLLPDLGRLTRAIGASFEELASEAEKLSGSGSTKLDGPDDR